MNTLIKKIYFARRILPNADSETVLTVHSDMTVNEVMKAYEHKILDKGSYIYNGHWILRGINAENSFQNNSISKDMSPSHIWSMVQQKIETSDIMLAIINSKAYGTIAEVGYASRIGKIAVYLLPDQDVNDEDLQDFWLIFQMAYSTKHLWKEQDIKDIPDFKKYGIHSIQEYFNFIGAIVPNFLKK